MDSINESRWLALIFSLYALLAFGYSLLMPIWEAPDEPAHYHLAWHLARQGRYPTLKHNYEAGQPRAYYYAASLAVRALDKFDPRLSDYFLPFEHKQNIRKPEARFDWTSDNYRFLLGVYLLRWMNIIIGALALWLNWGAFRTTVPDKPTLRLAAITLAALTPQYLHIMSSVSNDALGTLAGALLLYLTVRALKEQSQSLDLLLVILALVLPFITKLSVFPVSIASLSVVLWKSLRLSQLNQWWMISGFAILCGIAIFYFLFPNTLQQLLNEINWRVFHFRKNAFTNQYLTFILSQINSTFWGKVGWIAIGLPEGVVNLLMLAWFTGVVLTITLFLKTQGASPYPKLWNAVFLIALLTITAVLRNGLTTRASQGRLLFPAIGALSLLTISGWHGIVAARTQRFLPFIVVVFMLSLNILLWVTGIIPIYYQPFFD